MRIRLASLFLSAFALLACGDNNDDVPTDGPRTDAGVVDGAMIDAAMIDAAMIDAAVIDAAVIDAQVIDAVPLDAAIDAPPTAAELIGFARAASPGTGLWLPIMGATITYIKPQIGSMTNDPAGFTIQASQTGPALMIAVDPATLTPAPAVGDVVSFTITDMATVGGQPRATVITGYMRTATGTDVNPLVQNVSAATDLVTAIDSYDSELIDVTGTITGSFGSSGSGFERAQINTAGMTVADPNFQIRVPATLRDSQDMVMGCGFTLNNTPVGRFNAQVQLAAFTVSDITLSGCPAPVVMGAIATSPTSVQVTFSRNIQPTSVLPGGEQFSINNGLTVSGATVSGRVVTLTTSAQAMMMYTVTVTGAITDLQGTGIGTPNSAMFGGFVPPATVKINEFNANIAQGCDLIELRVISGGALTGFRLTERTGGADELNFMFPPMSVATNDLIVVHVDSGDTTNCNANMATQETTGVAQQPAAMFAGNFDTAYDFWATDPGLTATDNVFTLRDGTNAIVDVVFAANAATGTAAAATETAAASAATAGQWQMVGGGIPAGGFVDDNFRAHAALDLDGTGTMASGNSIQRLDNSDDNDKSDWNSMTTTVQAQTFGALNAGQTPF